jgi:hypothetical protein
MTRQLAIVLVYLLAIGLFFRRFSSANTLEFLLAGRAIGRLLLFFTMTATNFSSFTIFGLAGLAAILAGEAVAVLAFFRVVRVPGVLPMIPVPAAGIAAFVTVCLLTRSPRGNTGLVAGPIGRPPIPALAFAGFFVLANDFWAWGRRTAFLAGLPLWVWLLHPAGNPAGWRVRAAIGSGVYR